ncbi:uncharacterized protein LA080_008823 [Diaporthe eres]|nr:uncharacterized protein LA080_008823 [Diaporthe eres]
MSNVLEGDIQEVDDAILPAQGHQAVLTRQFNRISALGLAFSVTNSWVGYLGCFGQNLLYAAPQSCLLGLVVAFFVQGIVTTGLAELGSAFPSRGGQYHFCYILAPERWKNFAAFIVGWICSGLSLAAVTLSGLGNYWHADYVATQWQIYLIYIAVSTLTIMPLIMAPSKIAWTTQATLYLSVTGCFVFLVVVGAMHGPTHPASSITSPSFGSSGWSFGAAWVLGIINAMYAFGATDGVVMLMYYMTDLEAVTASALPSLEIVSQAIAWAFARDYGVPFSEYFSDIHPTLGFPLRTTLAASAFSCVYGLLYLASTTAFNSIVTSAVLFLNIMYAIPQGILLCRNREKALPPRNLNLGWFGYVCNIFSCTWIFALIVFICMPPRLPVDVGSINYTSVVLVGLVSIVFVLWIVRGKSKFRGPNIDWGLLQRANRVAAHR